MHIGLVTTTPAHYTMTARTSALTSALCSMTNSCVLNISSSAMCNYPSNPNNHHAQYTVHAAQVLRTALHCVIVEHICTSVLSVLTTAMCHDAVK
eukprot:20419-Heterococcus_DN1.PRE.4